MTIIEYFKLAQRNFLLIAFCLLCGSTTGFWLANKQPINLVEHSILVNLAIQDKTRATSAHDNLQAADHITESIQGWLKSHSFQTDLQNKFPNSLAFTAKKQEKDNLVISFTNTDTEQARTFSQNLIQLINQWIEQYNQKSDLNIILNAEPLASTAKPIPLALYLIISSLMGLIIGYLASWYYEIINNKLTSAQQFHSIFTTTPFSFSNSRDFKKHHQYFSKYLNQKYQHQPLQILDLTHKNKIGVETISKHGHFQSIKSWNIPNDLEHIAIDHPTIILGELGYTSVNDLTSLHRLGIQKVEGIIFDHVKR